MKLGQDYLIISNKTKRKKYERKNIYNVDIFFIVLLFSCNKNKIVKSKLTPEQKELVEKNENKTMKEIIDNLPEEGVWITAKSKDNEYLGAFIFFNSNKIDAFFEGAGIKIKIEKITYEENNMHVIFSGTFTGGEEDRNVRPITAYYSFDFSKEKLLETLSRYKKGKSPEKGVKAIYEKSFK
jgi:hypothetical protein